MADREGELLNLLGVRAHQILRAQRELQVALSRRDDVLVALQDEGIPKCRIGEKARDSLVLHGFEAEQIARLGLSDGNVRVILDRK